MQIWVHVRFLSFNIRPRLARRGGFGSTVRRARVAIGVRLFPRTPSKESSWDLRSEERLASGICPVEEESGQLQNESQEVDGGATWASQVDIGLFSRHCSTVGVCSS